MNYYYIVIGIIIFFQFFSNTKKNITNRLLFLSLLVLFLFAALRGNGNGDYFNYLRYSKEITTFQDVLNNNFPMEIGFRIISFVVNSLKLNSQFVISIMNGISIFCVYLFIKRYSEDKLFSVYLYLPIFFLFDMHTTRTAVAISIGALSLRYVYEKKILKFILVVSLASCFHKFAIVLLLVYFLNNLKRSYLFYISSILVTIFFVKLIDVNRLMISILDISKIGSNLSARFNTYINSVDYGYGFSLLDPRLLLLIIILIFSFYIIESKSLKNSIVIEEDLDFFRLLIKINWLVIILMILFSNNTIFVIRLYGLLGIYSIIQVPIFLNKYKAITNYSTYIVFKLVLGLVYFVYLILLLQGENYPEYIFYFNV